MKVALNPDATPVPNEDALIERLSRLNKRDDRPPIEFIGVKNEAGELRLRITAHVQAEVSSVTSLFENNGFFDELIDDTEEVDEDGNIEYSFNTLTFEDYGQVFRPRKPLH